MRLPHCFVGAILPWVVLFNRLYYNLTMAFLFALIFLLLTSNVSFANGGDQRVVEGEYLINLSRSPFTPKAGEKTAFIASFVDIQKDLLIAEDLIVKIRIAKLGEGRERKFLFEQDNIRAKGGILEFNYTFNEPGLHEIFFDFSFTTDPQKIYNAPDFLLDIQKTKVIEAQNLSIPIWIGLGTILGLGIGWFIFRRRV